MPILLEIFGQAPNFWADETEPQSWREWFLGGGWAGTGMRAGQLGRRTGGCQWVARPEWVGRWAGVGLGWGGQSWTSFLPPIQRHFHHLENQVNVVWVIAEYHSNKHGEGGRLHFYQQKIQLKGVRGIHPYLFISNKHAKQYARSFWRKFLRSSRHPRVY